MYLLRRVFKGTQLYPLMAKIYHFACAEMMRMSLLFSSVTYLPPITLGGDYKSQYGQDYYLEKLGLVSQGGFFVEVGCNHPIHNSNTHYLEKKLGWKGVSIDALDYSASYLAERDNTVFINAVVSEKEEELDFYCVKDVDGWENQLSSLYKETLKMGKGFDAEMIKVKALPLSKIGEINRTIDLCLVDVEGHEFSVLRSVDFENNPPKVFVIENNGSYYPRRLLVQFLRDRGYKHVARIGTSDDIFLAGPGVLINRGSHS